MKESGVTDGSNHYCYATCDYVSFSKKVMAMKKMCDLGSLEDIFKMINTTLTDADYDKAQDLLQESCYCYVAKWIEKVYK
jgi:hypothetical protein